MAESSAAAPDVVDVVALVVLDEVATGGGATATGAVEVITTTVGGCPGAVGVCVITEVITSGAAELEGAGGGGAWVVGAAVDTGVVEMTADVTAAFELGKVKVEMDVAVENMVDGGRVTADGVKEDGIVTGAAVERMLAETITRSHKCHYQCY